MDIIEQHTSPDGLLRFVVTRESESDAICLGFDGFPWHTHPELLANDGISEGTAIRRFVDQLLSGGALIALARVDGAIRDVWVTDDAESDLQYKRDGESIEFRYWNGNPATP